MKLFIQFSLIFIIFINTTKSQCHLQNTTFEAGEKLKYTVYYNLQFIWLEIADIELSTSEIVNSNKISIKLYSTWKTRPKYNWIMNVDDKYDAIIDNDSIIPYTYNQKIKEGKLISNLRYEYSENRDLLYAWIENSKYSKNPKTIEITQCVFDLLTSIYYARNINYSDYKPNHKIPYSALLGDKIKNLEIKYMGIETIKTHNDKSFDCIKIKPSIAETEMFKGGNDKLTAWFSNDKNQMPIMAVAELFIGSVKVILNTYEGLRYPINH